MGKKRKSSAATRLDEVDRSLYVSFSTAANSLSQLYTHSMNHQRLSFQAGERHSLEKLYQWIWRQHEDGARVSTVDIVSYLQHELEAGLGDPSMSPRVPAQHQNSQTAMHLLSPVNPDQHRGKNAVFSDALSSPVRRTLQHYHLAQGGYPANSNTGAGPSPSGNNRRNNEGVHPHHLMREADPASLNDTTMDMNSETQFADSLY